MARRRGLLPQRHFPTAGLDGKKKVLHNLVSLLLTNTTLRSAAEKTSAKQVRIFNN
jgi:hypothetical protein